jgi:hypothetical protein
MSEHLVAYEYGTGVVWGFVRAESADAITDAVPEVDVYKGAPAFFTKEDLDSLREGAIPLAAGSVVERLFRAAE